MSHIDEIIVIRAADPDGSVFKAIIAMLQEKKAEVIDVTTSASSALFLGDLEIRPNYRQVLVAGKEVSLNHSEYAMLYYMACSPGQVLSKEQLYGAAWDDVYPGCTSTVENTIYRLRKKLEPDPRNPIYIKTVIGAGYKIEIPNNPGRQWR